MTEAIEAYDSLPFEVITQNEDQEAIALFLSWYEQNIGTREQAQSVIKKWFITLAELHEARTKAQAEEFEGEEFEGGDPQIDTIVRLGSSEIWHGVSYDSPSLTFCNKAISEAGLTKSRNGHERICKRCVREHTLGSARTGI